MKRERFAYLLLSMVIVCLDQVSKSLIINHITGYMVLPLTPFLNLVHIENRGISFGLFHHVDAAAMLFTCIGIVTIVILFFWMWSLKRGIVPLGLALIIGGAAGNVWDRIRYGAVTDFIDVYWRQWHWPAFNIADAAICIGAVLIAFDALKEKQKPQDAE